MDLAKSGLLIGCRHIRTVIGRVWTHQIKRSIGMYFYVKYNDSDWMIVFTIILLFRLVDPLGHSFYDLPIG